MNPNIYVLLMGQRENKKAKKYGGKKLDGKKPEGNGAKPPPQAKNNGFNCIGNNVLFYCM